MYRIGLIPSQPIRMEQINYFAHLIKPLLGWLEKNLINVEWNLADAWQDERLLVRFKEK